MNLHFLHGFLGLPQDWALFSSKFANHKLYFHSIDSFLFSTNNNHDSSFEAWARAFNQYIFTHKDFENDKNILIGYSLGGRLSLHSLIQNHNWDGGIIISAHPGLSNHSQKIERLQNDYTWGQKFLNEKWTHVLKAWNSQAVFSAVKNKFSRQEKDFNKKNLAHILTHFSLGKQNNLQKDLDNLKTQLLWLTGSKDQKFKEIAEILFTTHKNITHVNILEAGHRVPWEAPDQFTENVRLYLEKYI